MPIIKQIVDGKAICANCKTNIKAGEGFHLKSDGNEIVLFCQECKKNEVKRKRLYRKSG